MVVSRYSVYRDTGIGGPRRVAGPKLLKIAYVLKCISRNLTNSVEKHKFRGSAQNFAACGKQWSLMMLSDDMYLIVSISKSSDLVSQPR